MDAISIGIRRRNGVALGKAAEAWIRSRSRFKKRQHILNSKRRAYEHEKLGALNETGTLGRSTVALNLFDQTRPFAVSSLDVSSRASEWTG